MAEYKDIHGTTVRNSDGNLSGAVTGELFYDATNRDFKYQYPNVTTAGAWRTGGNMNTARSMTAGAGTQTAALAMAGVVDSNDSVSNLTESYNGTSWTEVNDANTARRQHYGDGTLPSALMFGGYDPPSTWKDEVESWNGTSWTEVADLNSAK